jgi:hypothetical protein
MTDFAQALDAAVFARLEPAVTLATVYQHVPQDTPPPVVIIGDSSEGEALDKDGNLVPCEFEIVSVVRGAAREPLNAVQAEVRTALHGWVPGVVDGVLFGDVRQVSRDAQLLPDGEHYYGTQRFAVLAQPA